jgi:coenzyme F420-0:L-glutamate ligase/coenzyme F420-1:gamma-L-glutamate ligase
VNRLHAVGVPGVGEVVAGQDLAATLLEALGRAGTPPVDGDILVISSKVVSKAEGRATAASGRDPAVAAETARVVAERITPRGPSRIVQSLAGPVLAAAGVDASNVAVGTVLLLPEDPDASARRLHRDLADRTGLRIAVLISDTAGRPWREGQADIAIGAAGLRVSDDLRGAVDGHGNPLEVTVRAIADEIAALADLVKGKLDGVPAALVHGLGHLVTDDVGPGAAALLRSADGDWFRFGHVEAVRAALGVPPGTPGLEPVHIPPESVGVRLRRALDVAVLAPDPLAPQGAVWWAPPDVEDRPGAAEAHAVLRAGGPAEQDRPDDVDPARLLALGAAAQRVVAAAWTEGLVARVRVELGPPPALIVTARPVPPSG